MKGQFSLVINIDFHWLKGTNCTVKHIRSHPKANGPSTKSIMGEHPLNRDSGPSDLSPCRYVLKSQEASPLSLNFFTIMQLRRATGMKPSINPTRNPHSKPKGKKNITKGHELKKNQATEEPSL